MDRIPSALERALERVEKLGRASPEELQRAKHIEVGQKLAAQFLKGDTSLLVGLNKYDEEAREWVGKGALETLIRNIVLPSNDSSKRQNKATMEGIKLIKRDKGMVENVFSKIRQIFSHYTEQGDIQRKEAYENLKRETQARMRQAMQQQTGMPADIQSVERHPQFQSEWRRTLRQLDTQYLLHLKGYQEELGVIP